MEGMLEAVRKAAVEKYPRKVNRKIQYGTAGFRTREEYLDHVLYRMGILAAIRSQTKKATIGAMITASHNPEEDNGIKLIDPAGEMLEATWESHATFLANVEDEDLASAIKTIVSKENVSMDVTATVYVAMDTRKSSQRLSEALQCGVQAAGGTCKDYGLLTTPQLHFMVRCVNTNNQYGTATEEGYFQKLTTAFCKLRQQIAQKTDNMYKSTLTLDAANGIGAPKAYKLTSYLADYLTIDICNDGSSGKLNYLCGADYVKVQQKPADGMTLHCNARCASFDGDADRIVYYYADKDGKFHLMDGDKIATLVAGYLQELLSRSGLTLNLGLVQTAYANGSSTAYITKNLKVPVACAATGVKHLHHRALEFDLGVYFEANGHGTVIFSENASSQIQSAAKDSSLSEIQRDAAAQLCTVMDLINQTVGDAISDMLLVELILATYGWEINDWDSAYIDLPNRQLKVKVKDRTVITTANAERTALTPDGLQQAVDSLVVKYEHGRSFVRPSGTEDIVRVY
ncbi:phosphoacetylglucosamine mutase-like isoform X2 [Pecten maximus]|uniref:phosphoacetylglucosamine mutase-like isoform X2 n=1 Tax=Pecten maximus TaxID=6579 RepID=UPI0014583803|nr:phosphoacetylglucosamine mutase-like isoform X2 [Pecten maximus]